MIRNCIPIVIEFIGNYDIFNEKETMALIFLVNDILEYVNVDSAAFKRIISSLETQIHSTIKIFEPLSPKNYPKISHHHDHHHHHDSQNENLIVSKINNWTNLFQKSIKNLILIEQSISKIMNVERRGGNESVVVCGGIRKLVMEVVLDSLVLPCFEFNVLGSWNIGDVEKYNMISKSIPEIWIGEVYNTPKILKKFETCFKKYVQLFVDNGNIEKDLLNQFIEIYKTIKSFNEASQLGKLTTLPSSLK